MGFYVLLSLTTHVHSNCGYDVWEFSFLYIQTADTMCGNFHFCTFKLRIRCVGIFISVHSNCGYDVWEFSFLIHSNCGYDVWEFSFLYIQTADTMCGNFHFCTFKLRIRCVGIFISIHSNCGYDVWEFSFPNPPYVSSTATLT